jgi:hypothetical protein
MTTPHAEPNDPVRPVEAVMRHLEAYLGYLEQPAASAVERGNGYWFRFVIDTSRGGFDWESSLRGRLRQRGWSSAVVDDIVTQCDQQHALLRHLRQRGFLRGGC